MNPGWERIGGDLEAQALLITLVLFIVAFAVAIAVGGTTTFPVTKLFARGERLECDLCHMEVAVTDITDFDGLQ